MASEPRSPSMLALSALPFAIALCVATFSAAQAKSAEAEPQACNEQKPLPFLVRGNYALQDWMSPAEQNARIAMQTQALRFRTERYGRYRKTAPFEWNEHAVVDYIEPVEFMGLPVQVNRRIIPALRCVEAAIVASCGESPYKPQNVLGIRGNNTFHNGEVSNHLYGIAIDIDPERNPCCKCVEPFPDHPACKKQTSNAYERAELPRCWMDTFERYGFYWLGHDRLEDTMHFEFLGDPDEILKKDPSPK